MEDGGWGGGRSGGSSGAGGKEVNHLLQRLQCAEVLGLDLRSARQLAAERGHDLDALDGIHAKVGVEAHLQVQHLYRVAGLLGDDLQKRGTGSGG